MFLRLWRSRRRPDPYREMLEAQLSEAMGRRWEILTERQATSAAEARDQSYKLVGDRGTAAMTSRDYDVRITFAEESGRRKVKVPVRASTAQLAILVGIQAAVRAGLLREDAAIVRVEV